MSFIKDTSHRPYPPPDGPWVMRQTWSKLLFMHWPVPAAALQALMPPSLPVETFDGEAWISVVRPRLLPSVPWLSRFPELNVRTYVTLQDKPGVYFFSLEAGNPIAVFIARKLFKLAYFNAAMACTPQAAGSVSYHSRRTHQGAPPAIFEGRYRPTGPVYTSQPGSLEAWLTERYCLYTTDRHGRPYRGEIQHGPWPLQPAEAEVPINSMAQSHGIPMPDVPPLLQYVERLDMVTWLIQRLK